MRLAEINAANNLIEICKELREERQKIVNFLKVMNIIELSRNGGFKFVDNNF